MRRTKLTAAIVAIGAGIGAAALAIAQPAAQQTTPSPLVPAATTTHIAALAGTNEVPPNTATGTGTAWLSFDAQTNMLMWTVEFSGLTGVATGAHIHGPAAADANAGVVLSLATGVDFSSPIQGTAVLTAEQVAQLTGGLWYVNVHTTANAGGEICGQIAPVPPAAATATPPAAPVVDPAVLLAQLTREGAPLYRSNCVPCHGAAGQGGAAGPMLAGYSGLASAGRVANQIVNGSNYMPAFGHLSNREIAALGTYVRNTWGNAFGVVTEADVAAAR